MQSKKIDQVFKKLYSHKQCKKNNQLIELVVDSDKEESHIIFKRKFKKGEMFIVDSDFLRDWYIASDQEVTINYKEFN